METLEKELRESISKSIGINLIFFFLSGCQCSEFPIPDIPIESTDEKNRLTKNSESEKDFEERGAKGEVLAPLDDSNPTQDREFEDTENDSENGFDEDFENDDYEPIDDWYTEGE